MSDEGPSHAVARGWAISEMAAWFFDNFYEPMERPPYFVVKGRFSHAWGGPFYAIDVLTDEFQGKFPLELIEQAATSIESGGVREWTPKPTSEFFDYPPEDFFSGEALPYVPPPILTGKPMLNRLLEKVETIENILNLQQFDRPTIGHNQPPEAIESREFLNGLKSEVTPELTALRPVLESDSTADVGQLKQSASVFRKCALSILKWIGRKADLLVDESIKTLTNKTSLWLLVLSLNGLADDLVRIVEAISPF